MKRPTKTTGRRAPARPAKRTSPATRRPGGAKSGAVAKAKGARSGASKAPVRKPQPKAKSAKRPIPAPRRAKPTVRKAAAASRQARKAGSGKGLTKKGVLPRRPGGANGAAANPARGAVQRRGASASGTRERRKSRATLPLRPKVSRRATQSKQPVAPAEIRLPPNYRPSESEPFMNPRQREYFRRRLVEWRREVLRDSEVTLQHLKEEPLQEADLTDRATLESDRSIELRTRDRQRKLLAKIDSALRRIEDGSYGFCEETGEPITLRRLEARSIATLSIEAQERHERRERTHRDD
ncbi:MAG: RNA polymerase-binding protein DksA [Alphaproteobacteria bacterium]|nr:RNA polymerase-binding protein DksA [Alphaproteobacteria bacterium]